MWVIFMITCFLGKPCEVLSSEDTWDTESECVRIVAALQEQNPDSRFLCLKRQPKDKAERLA